MDHYSHAELVRRNVVEVLNTPDAAQRRELIEAMYQPDAVFYEASGTAIGRDAVIDAIGALLENSAGLSFSVTVEPAVLGDVARISWALSPPDAPAVASGQDFAVVKDGKIAQLYTFLDQN